MIVKTIGSGSSGNGYALISGEDILLLECGVPAKEMLKAIDYQTSMVNGCILSHIHGDHAGYIKQYIQYGIMVYTSDEVETDVKTVMGEKTIGLQRMKRQKIGSFEVVPFHVPHGRHIPKAEKAKRQKRIRAAYPLSYAVYGFSWNSR